MKTTPRLLAFLCGAALAFGAAAQTKTLGNPKGGKLLTREELRACIAQQKDLATRKPALEAERDKLERERAQFDEAEKGLDAERAAIDKLQATATDLNRRTQELSQQIADFNDRVRKFQSANPSGPTAERQQQALDRDKAALDKSAKELDAERASLDAQASPASKAYAERVAQRNQSAADWNARNAQFKRTAGAYESDVQAWRTDCDGRSYREDDEKAILSGR